MERYAMIHNFLSGGKRENLIKSEDYSIPILDPMWIFHCHLQFIDLPKSNYILTHNENGLQDDV